MEKKNINTAASNYKTATKWRQSFFKEENNESEIQHHGIKGMLWGKRRWQRKDGSLTPEGVKRYTDDNIKERQKSGDTRDFMNGEKSSGGSNVKTVSGKKTVSDDKVKDSNDSKNKKQKAADKVDEIVNKKSSKDKSAEEAKKENKQLSKKELKELGSASIMGGNTIKNQGVDIAKSYRKMKNAKEMEDYKSMSDAELKAKTNRIRMENEYVQVSMAKTTAAQQKVEGLISIIGGTLAVAGTGLSIYGMLKKD